MNKPLVDLIVEECKDEFINKIVEELDKVLGLSEDTAETVAQMKEKVAADITLAKPNVKKQTDIAQTFLQKIGQKMKEAGRYAVDKINEYLQNFAVWLGKLIGTGKLAVPTV